MGFSDSLPPVSRHFVFLRSAIPRNRSLIRSRGPREWWRSGAWFWSTGPIPVLASRGRPGLPGSWGAPCRRAMPYDPGGLPRPACFSARRCCLPHLPTASAPRVSFRGSIARPACSLCTLRPRGCAPRGRNTRYRLPAWLRRAGLATRWAPKRFRLCLHGFLLSKLSWRTGDSIVSAGRLAPRPHDDDIEPCRQAAQVVGPLTPALSPATGGEGFRKGRPGAGQTGRPSPRRFPLPRSRGRGRG